MRRDPVKGESAFHSSLFINFIESLANFTGPRAASCRRRDKWLYIHEDEECRFPPSRCSEGLEA